MVEEGCDPGILKTLSGKTKVKQNNLDQADLSLSCGFNSSELVSVNKLFMFTELYVTNCEVRRPVPSAKVAGGG